jgi:hypothetical protein
MKFLDKAVPVVLWHVHLGIDSFVGHVNAAQTLQGVPLRIEPVPNVVGAIQIDVAVKADGTALKGFSVQPDLQGLAVVFVDKVSTRWQRLFPHGTKVQIAQGVKI